MVGRVGEGSLSLQGESTAGEERWDGESKEALGGASGVVGCEFWRRKLLELITSRLGGRPKAPCTL